MLSLVSAGPDRRVHAHRPLDVFRRTAQGAGAGLLVLSGADAIGGAGRASAGAQGFDFTSFDGLTGALASGFFNDPLQIGLAVVIFLAAGQCIARLVGLAAVLIVFLMISQGVSAGDVMSFLGTIFERISAAAAAFMNPALVR